jgi:hypothetical protein
MVMLALTIAARYAFHRTGAWRSIWAAGATFRFRHAGLRAA